MTSFHSLTSAKKLEKVQNSKAAESAAPVYIAWEDSGGQTNMIAGPGLNWHRESDEQQPPAIPTTAELAEMKDAGFNSVSDLRAAKALET